ncbi:MAG: ATP-binding protein [Actinomycetota bacterium]
MTSNRLIDRRRELVLTSVVVAVGAAGAAILALMFGRGMTLTDPDILAVLTLAVIVAELMPIRVPWRNQELNFTLSTTFGMLILFAYGPFVAATILAGVVIVSFWAQGKGWMKIVFNGGQQVVCLGVATLAATQLGLEPGAPELLRGDLEPPLLPVVAAVVSYLVTNLALTSIPQALSSGTPLWPHLRASFRTELPMEIAYLLLVPVMLLALGQGLGTLAVTLVPVAGFYYAIRLSLQNAVLQEDKRKASELQRQTEERLRQAQKMEAIGQLAGGIAHDFNNLLNVILGFTDVLRERIGDAAAAEDLEEIRKAAERAAELTRQLLAFSRREVVAPRVLQLNDLVADMERMLRRTLGEDIDLRFERTDVPPVRVDPGQLEQILLNLAINARDAMPRGGGLTIETDLVAVSEVEPEADLPSGNFVVLRVRDTGSGIDPSILPRVFEPFFTSKERGHGTGLGLATVYGAVQQAGGHVTVSSEVGHGTVFSVYLPEAVMETESISTEAPVPGARLSGLTALVVEDEEAVSRLVTRILVGLGMKVFAASNGEEALAISADLGEGIDVIITDVVMPGMSGRELAKTLARQRPGVPVLYMSGYTDQIIAKSGVLGADEHLLQKPFSRDQLKTALASLLLESPSSVTPAARG